MGSSPSSTLSMYGTEVRHSGLGTSVHLDGKEFSDVIEFRSAAFAHKRLYVIRHSLQLQSCEQSTMTPKYVAPNSTVEPPVCTSV
jgi:hypothetical protein